MDFVDLVFAFWKLLLIVRYAGIILLMFLDNTILPFPGEIFLFFAGYLIYLGELSFWLVVLSAASGSVMGSAAGYWIGKSYGEKAVARYGRYVLLNTTHLERAKRWFAKHGQVTILYSRFVPGIGHLVSVPAGAARMHPGKFLLYSFGASLLWYFIMTSLAVAFSRNYVRFTAYLRPIQAFGITLLAVALLWIGYNALERKA